jgi:GcrA cell cycle regulator
MSVQDVTLLKKLQSEHKARQAKFFAVEAKPAMPDPPSPRMVDAQRIIDAVAIEFGVGSVEITGPLRDYPVAQARHVAVYLMREMLRLSYPELAEATGRDNHTTSIHSYGLASERVATCPEYAGLVERLKSQIGVAIAIGNGQITKRVSSEWPEERVQELRLWAASKLSASQIGDKLGCTRNAVIGKCSRLGIKLWGSHGGIRRPRTARPPRPSAPRRHRFIAFGKADHGAEVRPRVQLLPVPSLEFKVDFFGLNDKTCRFPLWGENAPLHEKFYCGAAPRQEGEYCPFHHMHTHDGFPRSRPSTASVETKFGLMRAAE